MNIQHPLIGALIVFVIAFGLRSGIEAYNESAATEEETCFDDGRCYKTTEEPIPWALAVLSPYVIAAAVGYFALMLHPFGLFIGLAAAAVLQLTFQDW